MNKPERSPSPRGKAALVSNTKTGKRAQASLCFKEKALWGKIYCYSIFMLVAVPITQI